MRVRSGALFILLVGLLSTGCASGRELPATTRALRFAEERRFCEALRLFPEIEQEAAEWDEEGATTVVLHMVMNRVSGVGTFEELETVFADDSLDPALRQSILEDVKLQRRWEEGYFQGLIDGTETPDP